MKNLLTLLAVLCCSISYAQHTGDRLPIVFGTPIDAATVMKQARKVAKTAEVKTLQTWEEGRDKKCAYFFEELGEEMPFRVCVPKSWDGKKKLPLVMFLHGGWNTESSYLDENDKLMVRLADEHGFLLVSPMGAHSSYGNRLLLPAGFGKERETQEVLTKRNAPELMREQELSEQDVVNVLEIVLKNYPVDRSRMFLCGHSMGSGGTWYLGAKYADYWRALAPMSGPFVTRDGYPWERMKQIPIFISEGTRAGASLQSSRDLRDFAKQYGLNYQYKEVDGDHGQMVPMILPDVFRFFNQYGLKAKPQIIRISGQSTGKTFDGIGIVNGGGATSVLLKDYPEPQRSEIMDLVYKPKFGASVSTLLVEIPGDGNSTQGSMPSHSHYRGDCNFHRGYMWWVMSEAKRRNPKLSLDATAWSAPAWVGSFWSQEMADYYVSWLSGLREVYGLELDAIGSHNEKGVSYDFAKLLRRTMNERGFPNVKLHAFDNWGGGKMDFLRDMQNDAELRDAIDIVSAHTFSEIPLTMEQREMAEAMGKPIWNSEDHVYRKGFDCLISIVKCFNENYIVSGATKVVNWYDIAGIYPLEPYSHDPAMVLTWEPWSGHYTVRENLWGYAHYGQFTEVGWQYVDDGCQTLDGGGTMVTLKNPTTGDFSIIIETKDATEEQTIKVKVAKGLCNGRLCVWRSTEQEQFMRQADIKPNGGSFTITLEPNAVYSLSTTTGQQKGSFTDIPASKPFPLPYEDNFDAYQPDACGYLPHYTADIIGAFELVERPDRKGLCLRQVVASHTLSWAPEWHHYTILGDSAWSDYEVSADVYLNPQDEAAIIGRICDVGSGYGVWAKGYYLKLNDQGQCTLVITRGKLNQKELIGDKEQQEAILARKDVEVGGEYVLASAQIEGIAPHHWHNLKLRFEGDIITGYVDGKEVLQTVSDSYPKGMAGLIAPMQKQRVSTPYFDNLKISPI